VVSIVSSVAFTKILIFSITFVFVWFNLDGLNYGREDGGA